MTRRRKSPRKSLGTVERHKVERWLANELRSSVYDARNAANHEMLRRRLEVAAKLVDMLHDFQRKEESS